MNSAHPAQRLGGREEFPLGALWVQLLPHMVPTVGPRVFVTLREGHAEFLTNTSPAYLRQLAQRLLIAACEAEALERRDRHQPLMTAPLASALADPIPSSPGAERAAPLSQTAAIVESHPDAAPSIFLRRQAD